MSKSTGGKCEKQILQNLRNTTELPSFPTSDVLEKPTVIPLLASPFLLGTITLNFEILCVKYIMK
jgi:hypothetical protein